MASIVIDTLNAALDGRYRIEGLVGEGGMATVYRARDLRHDRDVALKVLKPELAAVVGAERFLAEIRTTANLSHPHILPLHDSGEADGFLFYVMPYVRGVSLRERLEREHQLPVSEAIGIAVNVAEALDYAHRQGVIHRDIKPANILLQDGKPVISDFGIALAVGTAGGGRLTETGLSMGTPHYMSPEQATGDQAVGPATDVYALGCVLYEMLVGEPPFTGATPQAILGKIITGEVAPIRDQRRSVPPNVDGVVARALEKVPADRFTSATEMAAALNDPGFRHGAGEASASGSGRGLWNPLSVGMTIVAVLLVGAVLALLDREEAPRLVSRFAVSLPSTVASSRLPGSELAVSPDGSRIVYRGYDRTEARLWVRPLDSLEATPIPGTEGALSHRFSPDGRFLVFAQDGSVRVMSLGGEPPRTLGEGRRAAEGGYAWGRDGNVYLAGLSGIVRMPAEGGERESVTQVAPSSGERHRWPEPLPNGTGLLFSRDGGTGPPEILVRSEETGETRVLGQGVMPRYIEPGYVIYATVEGRMLVLPFDVETLEATGTPRIVAEGIYVSPQLTPVFDVSPSGVLVYRRAEATSDGGGPPLWVRPDGSVESLDPRLNGSFSTPSVSPDGRRIAFQHRPPGGQVDIWIYDLDRNAFERLTFEGVNQRPFWHPDGTEVGFTSDRGEGLSIYARSSDFSGAERMLRRSGEAGRPPQEAEWTPDGTGLVFRRGNPQSDRDIFFAPPHPDSAETVVVGTPFAEQELALSPDGRWLAYASNESGAFEVYVRPFPGPGIRVPVSLDGGRQPVWSRDGSRMYYLSPEGVVVETRIRTDSEFEVVSREPKPEWPRPLVLPPSQFYDAAPDGSLIVAPDFAGSAGEASFVVVLNFDEVLRDL